MILPVFITELIPKLKVSLLDLEYGPFNRATDNENNSETFTDVGIKIGFGMSSYRIFLFYVLVIL